MHDSSELPSSLVTVQCRDAPPEAVHQCNALTWNLMETLIRSETIARSRTNCITTRQHHIAATCRCWAGTDGRMALCAVADVKREGWLYRESTILDGWVNPRYSAVYAQALVTFRSPPALAATTIPKLRWQQRGNKGVCQALSPDCATLHPGALGCRLVLSNRQMRPLLLLWPLFGVQLIVAAAPLNLADGLGLLRLDLGRQQCDTSSTLPISGGM